MYLHLSTRHIKRCLLPHVCVWCGEYIQSGDSAITRAYIFENEFQYDYLHPECETALNSSKDIEDGFDSGQFIRGTTREK